MAEFRQVKSEPHVELAAASGCKVQMWEQASRSRSPSPTAAPTAAAMQGLPVAHPDRRPQRALRLTNRTESRTREPKRLGSGHRTGSPCPAEHRLQDLFGASTAFGAEPNAQAFGGGHRPAWRAAGAQPRCGRAGDPIRPGIGEDRAEEHLRAQELLLSGSPQGLPDQPVRAAGGGRAARSPSASAKATRPTRNRSS